MRKWVSLKRCKTITALLVAAVMLLTAGVAFAEEVPETVDMSGTKTWEGDKPDDRPESIVIVVKDGDGNEVEGVTPEWTKNDDDNKWTFIVSGLQKYDDDGNLINYTLEEEEVEGYDSSVTQGGYTAEVEGSVAIVNPQNTDEFELADLDPNPNPNFIVVKKGSEFVVWTQTELGEGYREGFIVSFNGATDNASFGQLSLNSVLAWLFGNAEYALNSNHPDRKVIIDVDEGTLEFTHPSVRSQFAYGTYVMELSGYEIVNTLKVVPGDDDPGDDDPGDDDPGDDNPGDDNPGDDNPVRPRNPRRPSIPLGAGTEEEFDAIPLGLPQTGDANSLYGLFVIFSGILLAAGAATVSRKVKQK